MVHQEDGDGAKSAVFTAMINKTPAKAQEDLFSENRFEVLKLSDVLQFYDMHRCFASTFRCCASIFCFESMIGE